MGEDSVVRTMVFRWIPVPGSSQGVETGVESGTCPVEEVYSDGEEIRRVGGGRASDRTRDDGGHRLQGRRDPTGPQTSTTSDACYDKDRIGIRSTASVRSPDTRHRPRDPNVRLKQEVGSEKYDTGSCSGERGTRGKHFTPKPVEVDLLDSLSSHRE